MSGDVWVAGIVTLILSIVTPCTRPITGRCPAGYDLRTGVRPSGVYECWPNPVGDPMYDGAGGFPELSVQSEAIVRSRIYCTGAAHPIVVSERVVGCQR